jgi:hypothetical protein
MTDIIMLYHTCRTPTQSAQVSISRYLDLEEMERGLERGSRMRPIEPSLSRLIRGLLVIRHRHRRRCPSSLRTVQYCCAVVAACVLIERLSLIPSRM